MSIKSSYTSCSDKVPELRFPEFAADGFTSHKFENLFNFSTGKNIKQREASPEFKTPCVRYGELYHMYNEVIYEVINRTNLDSNELLFSDGDEILLPSAGEDPLDIGSASALTLPDIAIGRTINILKPKNDFIYSQIFLSYYINQKLKRKISSLAKGVSISNVYNSDLKKLRATLPSLPEQQKIATFLTAIDQRIQLLEKKKAKLEAYKKGVVQQLFSQQIRFKDENGNKFPDWEEKRLGEVCDYEQPTKYLVSNTEYRDEYETPVLTAGKTFLLGYTNETDGVFEENLPTIIFDDFTTAFQFVDFPFKAKSSAMKMLIPKKNNVNIRFVFEAMKTIKFPLAEHKRYWISEFQKERIPYPSKAEQQKIATFLSSLDELLGQVGEEIGVSQRYKKGLLQKMFV